MHLMIKLTAEHEIDLNGLSDPDMHVACTLASNRSNHIASA
jgi:hypothetical protein